MKISQEHAECFVYTEREGVLSPVGHDLKLRVENFSIDVEPGRITATFDPTSLRVLGAVKLGELDSEEPSDRDRKKIERNITESVLEASTYPSIEFESSSVESDGESVKIVGSLNLHGRTRSVELALSRQLGEWGMRYTLDQTRFGIKPYKALLGQLRIKKELEIEFRISEDRFDQLEL